jgi:uncharacterized protein YbbC (DUF1343 family)
MVNEKFNADVKVVKMRGWERPLWFEETGLPWVQPSPNIPSLETAIVYPGTCLFEGINVSEGRGTTRPFEYIGAPWINGEKWAFTLNDLSLPGVRFRACSFIPTFWRFKDEVCHGVQLHVTDRSRFQPVLTGLHMFATLLSMNSSKVLWGKSNEGTFHFDLLAGTDKTRKLLMQGASVDEISQDWLVGVEEFMAERRNNLLYPEERP